MEDYQREFIRYSLEIGALKTAAGDEKFKLKSGRVSPLYFNAGDFSDGASLEVLGTTFAEAISRIPEGVEIVGGPAYKGVPLCVATAIALQQNHGIVAGYLFDRKEAKTHGEGTAGETRAERARRIFVGRIPREHEKVVVLDDVITTGDSKNEFMEKLNEVSAVNYVAVVVGLDRQETTPEGKNAAKTLEARTGVPVIPVITTTDIIEYLAAERFMTPALSAEFNTYFERYGTDELRHFLSSSERR